MKSKDEKWALFWCNLLHPVIFGEIEKEQTNHVLRGLCLQEVVFPNGKRKRPSISTLRRKLNRHLKLAGATEVQVRRLTTKGAYTLES